MTGHLPPSYLGILCGSASAPPSPRPSRGLRTPEGPRVRRAEPAIRPHGATSRRPSSSASSDGPRERPIASATPSGPWDICGPERDASGRPPTIAQVVFMEYRDCSQMVSERRLQRFGQHRHAVLCAFAVPNRDVISGEVDVPRAEAQAFHQPKPRAVHQRSHQPRVAVKVRRDRLDRLAGHDDGQAPRLAGADMLRHRVENGKNICPWGSLVNR